MVTSLIPGTLHVISLDYHLHVSTTLHPTTSFTILTKLIHVIWPHDFRDLFP